MADGKQFRNLQGWLSKNDLDRKKGPFGPFFLGRSLIEFTSELVVLNTDRDGIASDYTYRGPAFFIE